jgi:formylglycine-generating enzyme required for sulfatase activity
MANGLTQLHRFMVEHYSLEDLRTLCFDLSVNYDDLVGEALSGKARELILRLGRERRIKELLAHLQEARPEAFAEAGLDTTPATLDGLSAALSVHFLASAELSKIEDAIAAQERLHGILSDKQFEAALSELRQKQASLQAQLWGGGIVAQDHSVAAMDRSAAVGGDVGGHVIVAQEGATIVIGEAPVPMPAVDHESALGQYLRHVISRNRYLQLQGIRSGGRLVHIELEQIYVTLRATRQRTVEAEDAWLEAEAHLAPGESKPPLVRTETVTVSVDEALAAHPRMVVLGDPGSGKTTLLRHLALLYARDLAEGTGLVQDRLGPDERGRLPILLPLRRLGAYLTIHRPVDDGTEGHRILLDHLHQCLTEERVSVPNDFFDSYLQDGQAVILLDGLDEVADPNLRRRISRLVETFTTAYSSCRYVVSSRLVGYTGPARLGEGYVTTTVRDFTLVDVERFLRNWHLAVTVGQMGPGKDTVAYALEQTQQLLVAIRANERIRDLAINPLMLTVIALVHRDRVKLPDRRAELYDEAVNVLLGKWDEARGVQEMSVLEDRPFDAGDKRLILQTVALWMQEHQQKEIEAEDLRRLLEETFRGILGNRRVAARATDRFLQVIQERAGLLGEHGVGIYRFSHLTFQEYLAALAIAGRDDYVTYTLERVVAPWWRETILLEVGYLSTQSRERTIKLIHAIADHRKESEPYYNTVLAAEAVQNIGSTRVDSTLWIKLQAGVREDVERRPPLIFIVELWRRLRAAQPALGRLYDAMKPHLPSGFRSTLLEITGARSKRRNAAAKALADIGGGYWTEPYGEPEWVEIPAGKFWMGSNQASEHEAPLHQTYLERFLISRTLITCDQYRRFVEMTGQAAPGGWEDGRPPRMYTGHPVVEASWYDALAYCQWLSEVTGKLITLPSEAQWEKAARGSKDHRTYPWGNEWDRTKCNNQELEQGGTTPVGIFPEGASPYGVLDMTGNVWEWTTSIWGKDLYTPEFKYPYDPTDGRENQEEDATIHRILRGESFFASKFGARCTQRGRGYPSEHRGQFGFRVCIVP